MQHDVLSISMRIVLLPVVISKKTTNHLCPLITTGRRQLAGTGGWRGALLNFESRFLNSAGVFTLTSKHW